MPVERRQGMPDHSRLIAWRAGRLESSEPTSEGGGHQRRLSDRSCSQRGKTELCHHHKKGKGLPYSLPSVGPGADPGVQAAIHPAVGCHYFPPGLRLPSQPQSITAPWPVRSYTAWWQRHIPVSVNNLPKVVMQLLSRVGFEPTIDLLIASPTLYPLRHRVTIVALK